MAVLRCVNERQAARRAALGEVIERRRSRMVALAKRVLGDEETARDAVQDASLLALRALDGFADRARLSTWLHRIVVNTALLQLRRDRRRRYEPLETLDSGAFLDVTSPPPEATVAQRQVRALVRRSIDALPPTQRTILRLRDLYDLDTVESATRLGLSPNVVKVRLHRARQALRRRLEGMALAG